MGGFESLHAADGGPRSRGLVTLLFIVLVIVLFGGIALVAWLHPLHHPGASLCLDAPPSAPPAHLTWWCTANHWVLVPLAK